MNKFHNILLFTVPSPVANLTIETIQEDDGSISLVVSWDEPESDQPITSYEGNYRTDTAPTWQRQFSNITNQHKYTNVLEGKNHDVRVRAVSSLGHGRFIITSALCMYGSTCSLNVYNMYVMHCIYNTYVCIYYM